MLQIIYCLPEKEMEKKTFLLFFLANKSYVFSSHLFSSLHNNSRSRTLSIRFNVFIYICLFNLFSIFLIERCYYTFIKVYCSEILFWIYTEKNRVCWLSINFVSPWISQRVFFLVFFMEAFFILYKENASCYILIDFKYRCKRLVYFSLMKNK